MPTMFAAFALEPERISENAYVLSKNIGIEMSSKGHECFLFKVRRAPGLSRTERLASIFTLESSGMISDTTSPLRFGGLSLITMTIRDNFGYVVFAWTYNNFVILASADSRISPSKIIYAIEGAAKLLVSIDIVPKKFMSLSKRVVSLNGGETPTTSKKPEVVMDELNAMVYEDDGSRPVLEFRTETLQVVEPLGTFIQVDEDEYDENEEDEESW